MIDLVRKHVFQIAGIPGVDFPVLRFGTPPSRHEHRRVAILFTAKVRSQPGKIVRIVFIHRRLDIGPDDDLSVRGIAQEDEHDRKEGNVRHFLAIHICRINAITYCGNDQPGEPRNDVAFCPCEITVHHSRQEFDNPGIDDKEDSERNAGEDQN